MTDACGDPVVRAALEATRALTREGLIASACRGLLSVCGGAAAVGMSVTPSGDDLERIAVVGSVAPHRLASLDELDAGWARHVAGDGPVILPDAAAVLDAAEAPDGGAAHAGEPVLVVPLAASTSQQGLVFVFAAAGEAFDPAAPARARALAEELVAAFDNVRTVESLRELVIRDDTADCYNRRHLDRTLEDEIERCRRFGGRFSVIFLDMDDLKSVNTRFGHAAGSRVLYEASVRISRSIRSIDRLFRYGGDEFVVLLPGTGTDGAVEVAERVRRELKSSPFVLGEGESAELSASTGVASWPDHGATPRRVIEAADRAMRAVKASGKDRVAVAGSTAEGEAGGP